MRTLTWTSADGISTVLDGSAGVIALADPVGVYVPDPVNTVDQLINFDGGVLVNRSRPPRKIALGLYFEHASRVETVVGDVAFWLQGPGTLTWSDPARSRTLRQVIYDGGLDGSGEGDLLQRTAVVSLLALDPWYYGPTATQTMPISGSTAFDASIVFSSSTPFNGGGTVAVPISGDTDAYPVFTITGPVDTLAVGAGDVAWQLASPLTASDTLVVDHRPTSRGPRINSGDVDWSLLSEASRLWPLARGLTSVVVGATGTTGATSIVLSWEPRYLTP